MNEKIVNINNFIGVYDNYITKEECDKAIKLFKDQDNFNNTMNRISTENSSVLHKQDQHFFAAPNNIKIWHSELKSMILNFDMAFRHYDETTGAGKAFGVDNFHYTNLKIQKTLPTEGYHIWHIEHTKGFDNEPRAFVFSIYLNDVEDGGPKTGRIVIWPASFPYVHRGNPPLSGEKYILTSWLMLRP